MFGVQYMDIDVLRLHEKRTHKQNLDARNTEVRKQSSRPTIYRLYYETVCGSRRSERATASLETVWKRSTPLRLAPVARRDWEVQYLFSCRMLSQLTVPQVA